MSRLPAVFFALIAMFLCVTSSFAQSLPGGVSEEETKPTLPAELTEAAIRDAVAKMDDAAVRQMLIERLDAVVAAENAKKIQRPGR